MIIKTSQWIHKWGNFFLTLFFYKQRNNRDMFGNLFLNEKRFFFFFHLKSKKSCWDRALEAFWANESALTNRRWTLPSSPPPKKKKVKMTFGTHCSGWNPLFFQIWNIEFFQNTSSFNQTWNVKILHRGWTVKSILWRRNFFVPEKLPNVP